MDLTAFGVIAAIATAIVALSKLPAEAFLPLVRYRQEQLDRKARSDQTQPASASPNLSIQETVSNTSVPSFVPSRIIQLDERLEIPRIYGRDKEIDKLKGWIFKDNCRIIGVSGMSGIGKSTLVSALVKQVRQDFEFYVGLSLKNSPKIEETLECLLTNLQKKRSNVIPPSTINQQILSLVEILRKHRCLIVLDNAEDILSNGRVGQYREGFENYEELINKVGSLLHRSCLIVIGQELPEKLGISVDFQPLKLEPLQTDAGWKFFHEYYVSKGQEPCSVELGADPDKEIIVNHYAGNPLMLKLASAFVQDLYQGNVSQFVDKYLSQGMPQPEAIEQLLKLHFSRLSERERSVMYWLAIEREPITLEDLQKNALSPEGQGGMAVEINSLVNRRSLVERNGKYFYLPDVLMAYTTKHLVEEVCKEIAKYIENP